MANKFFRNIVQSTGYRPFSSEAMIAKAASPIVEEGVADQKIAIDAVVHNNSASRAQLKKSNEMAGAIGLTALGGASTAGSVLTYGILPTIMSEAAGFIGSSALGYAGKKLDEKYDTHWISPTAAVIGGMFGGAGGFNGAKRIIKSGSAPNWATTREFRKELLQSLPQNALEEGKVSKKFIASVAADQIEDAVDRHPGAFYQGPELDKIFESRILKTSLRDNYIDKNLTFGKGDGMLVHGDPAATGVKYVAAGIGLPAGNFSNKYPTFINGKLTPGKGNISSVTSKSFSAEKHPIFWGDGVPFFETVGKKLKTLQQWAEDPQFKDYMSSTNLRTIYSDPNAMPTEVPYRYLVIKNTPKVNGELITTRASRDMNEIITRGNIDAKDVVGHEYMPLFGTFARVIYK